MDRNFYLPCSIMLLSSSHLQHFNAPPVYLSTCSLHAPPALLLTGALLMPIFTYFANHTVREDGKCFAWLHPLPVHWYTLAGFLQPVAESWKLFQPHSKTLFWVCWPAQIADYSGPNMVQFRQNKGQLWQWQADYGPKKPELWAATFKVFREFKEFGIGPNAAFLCWSISCLRSVLIKVELWLWFGSQLWMSLLPSFHSGKQARWVSSKVQTSTGPSITLSFTDVISAFLNSLAQWLNQSSFACIIMNANLKPI